MIAEISTGAWLLDYPDGSENLRVEVHKHGEITIQQGSDTIRIEGANVREAFWLADALQKAGELSKKRPLS